MRYPAVDRGKYRGDAIAGAGDQAGAGARLPVEAAQGLALIGLWSLRIATPEPISPSG